MLKKLLISILLLGIQSNCFADLYFIINSNTKEVDTVFESGHTKMKAKDVNVAEGYELIIYSGSWEDYEFERPITNYKYMNGNLVKDIAKIDKQYQDKIKKEKKAKEDKLIWERMYKIARDQLVLEGLVDE